MTQLGQLVGEKELHLRDSLLTMGMRNSVYWATWLVANMLWNTLTAVLLVVFGWVFQFDFFLKNDFGTYSILFLLFGWAMVPFAFFCSLFLSRARTATSLGFAIFLFGIMLQVNNNVVKVVTVAKALLSHHAIPQHTGCLCAAL